MITCRCGKAFGSYYEAMQHVFLRCPLGPPKVPRLVPRAVKRR